MINIISTQDRHPVVGGPAKVFRNLIKGLDKIGYPYVINRDLNATKRLWIHDDVTALRYLHLSRALKIAGPNLYSMPRDIPKGIVWDNVICVLPSAQTVARWKTTGFDSCKLVVWPVGIDTEEFYPSNIAWADRRVMVYHKWREPNELPIIFEALHRAKLNYTFVYYGRYSETEFKQLLDQTSFVIWHGGSETQGIALQEIMACDIPILVCDVRTHGDDKSPYLFYENEKSIPATAVPYFADCCGIRVTDLSLLEDNIRKMAQGRFIFAPREYVMNHLSLESQATKFVSLWIHWDLTVESGLHEQASNCKPFAVPLPQRLQQLTVRAIHKLTHSVN